MYKILLADDEGIVLDSLCFIIERNFKGDCVIETAKTGRRVIEIAESFHPDIAFMDIQMGGINGIEAMKEIRKTNENMILIVLTAYDLFDYARESVNLGVMKYLNKPIEKKIILEVLTEAMKKVDERKSKRKLELKNLETMESMLPLVEKSFVDTLLFHSYLDKEMNQLKAVLGISCEYGLFLVLLFESFDDGASQEVIGQIIQTESTFIREQLKELDVGIVGAPLQNKIPVFLSCSNEEHHIYKEKIRFEKIKVLIKRLEAHFPYAIRVGVGEVKLLKDGSCSYYEATEALLRSSVQFSFYRELKNDDKAEESYLMELERRIQESVVDGDVMRSQELSNLYCGWLQEAFLREESAVKLKLLELVLFAEKSAYECGSASSSESVVEERKDYLSTILEMDDLDTLQKWFSDKLKHACSNRKRIREENSKSTLDRGKEYIKANFHKDISLSELAEELHVSPHYFSRLFKAKTGMNYIEYLTETRIKYAKKMLLESQESIQKVCMAAGYADPNYFSRIFKKYVGVSPSEFKEKGQEEEG